MTPNRLTFTIISNVMKPEEALKEFDHAKRCMHRDGDFSSVRATHEAWDGQKWVIVDRFEHERR